MFWNVQKYLFIRRYSCSYVHIDFVSVREQTHWPLQFYCFWVVSSGSLNIFSFAFLKENFKNLSKFFSCRWDFFESSLKKAERKWHRRTSFVSPAYYSRKWFLQVCHYSTLFIEKPFSLACFFCRGINRVKIYILPLTGTLFYRFCSFKNLFSWHHVLTSYFFI